ncbi:MAG TPA: SDR family NAD(P)-dependent oxidoreductase [Bryobacteraceae bacterium]|nr:SDR family NAD(P)-dependent oxidoreductase [Bryobacteraceae bacterium]
MPTNPLDLTGRAILVTGASSGIGRDTAVLLSELGATLILVARNVENLEKTRSQLRGAGHITAQFDVAEASGLPTLLKELSAKTGPLHGIVHCAGVYSIRLIRSLDLSQIEQMLRVNLSSAMLLVKGFRQKSVAAKGGSVVLLSSAAAVKGQAGLSLYSASKAALIGFARSAAVELAPEGLRVNCIAPGWVETPMTREARESMLTDEQASAIEKAHPLGIGHPRDVAHAAAFLLADTGRWVTGTTLVVDGGFSAQ